ncbi:peptidoglycan-binding protein [Phormidesmis priestleyi ULC007]|uniref:Peptidoglycan-binding protein n=1 Tax=Phormidesmis priestleyi ULC007 TaxID=1920490 RepID=A0A2T1D786_9CYAN|nr:peptidoglycan-binding domain-containing protein [Phormidesmis priestleyi]PSB16372.1 peptidoglycan-binding protein [Phormidesmis priestleyi ULC007]PZO47181.1 MAG: peptidoglycan-binding protein [Phormidesmis priestleyi]
MLNRLNGAIATVLVIAAWVAGGQSAWAVRSQNYTPDQFVSVLFGFGYPVTPGTPLIDVRVQQAIRDFQTQYRLPVDGTLNAPTQDKAASLVSDLQTNLNRAMQPSPQLPGSQFYGAQTKNAVALFQRQNKLPETGIATLETYQRLQDIISDAIPLPGQPTTPIAPTAPPVSSVPIGTLYNETDFRAVLLGLGYDVNPAKPLNDAPAVRAIRDFQQRYGLSETGRADQPTQEKAAIVVRNLRNNLKTVLRNNLSIFPFYDDVTQASVRQFQTQAGLRVDGIATQTVRAQLDATARRVR